MSEIIIYTTEYCPYCTRAKSLFDSKSVDYKEEKFSQTDTDKWLELEKRTGMKTVPQIFIDGNCIGGYQELAALNDSGELDKLLRSE